MTDGYFVTMGIVERRIREKEERRKIILDEAKRLILEKGVASFSMQDIADATELSKATLYLYFENKEAILTEILQDAMDYFIEYVEERTPADATGLESLRCAWSGYLNVFGESWDVFVLTGIRNYIDPIFLRNPSGNESPVGEQSRRLNELLSGLFAKGVADGTLDPSLNPQQAARTVILIATSIVDTVARLPAEARNARLILDELRSTFELLLRGVAAEGTDKRLLIVSKTENEKEV